MIVNSNVVACKYIKSEKTGQEFYKLWVNVPPQECDGEPVESIVVPYTGVPVSIGDKCIVSVDRFGRLNDVQVLGKEGC